MNFHPETRMYAAPGKEPGTGLDEEAVRRIVSHTVEGLLYCEFVTRGRGAVTRMSSYSTPLSSQCIETPLPIETSNQRISS